MKIGPIIMCIFIFLLFAILLSFAVICVVEAIENIVIKIRKAKYKKIVQKQSKINWLDIMAQELIKREENKDDGN